MKHLESYKTYEAIHNDGSRIIDDEAVIGKRVRLIKMEDPHTKLKEGDEGTIRHIDDIGTIHVNWDSGSSLGLIPGEDKYEILKESYDDFLNDIGYSRGDSMEIDDMLDTMSSDLMDLEELEWDIEDFIEEISIDKAQDLGFKGFVDLYNEEYPYDKIYDNKMDFARRVYNRVVKNHNQIDLFEKFKN